MIFHACRRLFFLFSLFSISLVYSQDNTVKNVLTVGGVVCDTFVTISKQDSGIMHINDGKEESTFILLHEGAKVDLTHVTQFTGGGAGNTAVAFARLGCHVSTYCKMGHDQAGQKIIDEFNKEGVSTQCCAFDDKFGTGVSFIIPSPSGDRTALVFRGSNTKLQHDELPKNIFNSLDCVYITSLSGPSGQILVPIAQLAHEKKVLVAANPGAAQLQNGAIELKKALGFIDILVLNLSEAQKFIESMTFEELVFCANTKTHSTINEKAPLLTQKPIKYVKGREIWLDDFIETILSKGPKIVVITNGKEGAYAGAQDGFYYHPSLPVSVKITLGAGDAFGSTFVASILFGESIGCALRNATINSSSVVCFEGAKTGLLTKDALALQASKIGKSLIVSCRDTQFRTHES